MFKQPSTSLFFFLQVVFTPTLMVTWPTAVKFVQTVLTWHMTKILENQCWIAGHVLTVITQHVLLSASLTHCILFTLTYAYTIYNKRFLRSMVMGMFQVSY